MTDTTLDILGLLQESCTDVVQIISKIRRFGLKTVFSDMDGMTTRAVLEEEIARVYFLLAILMNLKVLDSDNIEALVTQLAKQAEEDQKKLALSPADNEFFIA